MREAELKVRRGRGLGDHRKVIPTLFPCSLRSQHGRVAMLAWFGWLAADGAFFTGVVAVDAVCPDALLCTATSFTSHLAVDARPAMLILAVVTESRAATVADPRLM